MTMCARNLFKPTSNVLIIKFDTLECTSPCMNTGPSTPARDKGKGISMSPQQQALQASHAIMQSDAGGVDRYRNFKNLPASSAAGAASLLFFQRYEC